jgi:tetratricopeptide (TPR) repeat protein
MCENIFYSLMELCKEKRFDEARRKYNEFAKLRKKEGELSARYISWLAKIEGLSGNLIAEIAILKRVLKIYPNHYSAHFMIARAEIKLNKYEDSIKSGQSVLAHELELIDKPFSGAAAFLISYAAMKLSDKETFERFIGQVDDDHAEWLEGGPWSKQNLIEEVKRTFGQK